MGFVVKELIIKKLICESYSYCLFIIR